VPKEVSWESSQGESLRVLLICSMNLFAILCFVRLTAHPCIQFCSTMGCLQATEVIKMLLGKEGICSGRVLTFDALKMKFREIGLAKRENEEKITELIDYQGFCAGPKSSVKSKDIKSKSNNQETENQIQQEELSFDVQCKPNSFDLLKAKAAPRNGKKDPKSSTSVTVTGATTANGRTMDETETSSNVLDEDPFHSIDPRQCLQKLVDGWTPWVLDVRLPTEHDIVALPFTDQVVPHRSVDLEHIPKAGDVLVYCKGGVRGEKACKKLVDLGVDADRLYNLDGGIMRWQKDIDTSMPRY
jgi:rhodanese-related sulfurtransferase